MGTTRGETFEVVPCRICASDITKNDGIHIFAEDGRRHYLQTKIRKYLYILVSTEDKLPKMVCSICIKKLEGVHRFAMMAYRSQERLKVKFYETTVDKGTAVIVNNRDPVDQVEGAGRKDLCDLASKKMQEDRGLLHSILTKGALEILNEDDPLLKPTDLTKQEEGQLTSSMEEMEVKVDPMIFLQCRMDRSKSDVSDNDDEEEEVDEPTGRTDYPSKPLPLTRKIDAKSREDIGTAKASADEESNHSDESASSNRALARAHVCTICSRSFISQIGLQNHLWSHLPRGDAINKSDCEVLKSQRVFQTNGDSNSTGNFICPICSKKISTKGNLKVHLETHRPKGKYGCDICGRIFKTQSNLFRHKEHHGGIQFPCNECGRVYPTNSTLRAHSITHSDIRPHACPLCDKTFKRNQDLKFHINQHTGARPYQCPYCPKAFASSGNCFSHRKRMHPREVHRDRQRAADLMR